MLLPADPHYPLRISSVRSVYNGVFVDEAPLLDTCDLELLRLHFRKLWPTTFLGDIDTKGYFEDGAVSECVDRFRVSARKYLTSYGFFRGAPNALDLLYRLDFLVSRGARPHTDVHNSEWHESLFCVYVLEAGESDLYFPNLGLRIALKPGQLIIFDPGQPHAVVGSGAASFRNKDFPARNRQGFIAGTLRYDQDFWQQLGVTTDPRELNSPDYQDIVRLDVHRNTGELLFGSGAKHGLPA